jgi:hypothetical protein
VLAGVLLLCALNGTFGVAEAAPEMWLTHAQDGTLVVVGDGWRAGQVLVISLGGARFPAFVDSAGGFEVATGVVSYQGALAVADPRAAALAQQASARSEAPSPSPLAVAFAQNLAAGMELLASGLVVLGGALVLQRHWKHRLKP